MSFLKKITKFGWAFIVAFAIFFVTGLCSLGCVRSTGDSFLMRAQKTVYYNVTLKSGESLDAVYINFGSLYVEPGENVTVTVKYSTATTTGVFASFGSAVAVGNVYSETGKSGVNYNWLKIASEQNKKSVKRISVETTENVQCNEIVCLNADGERLPLSVNNQSTDYYTSEIEKSLDAQKSFSNKANAYYNYTQEEIYYKTAVDTAFGNINHAENTYLLDGNYNFLATLLFAGSSAVFGGSVFALRLPAFLATSAMAVFFFLSLKELTKKDKYAFFGTLFFLLFGLAFSVGRTANGSVFVASALMGSLYFMVRFFSRGISSKAIVKGSMNVFLSGIFASIALATDLWSVLPVAGILTLFAFGLRRQKKSYAVELEKENANVIEKRLKNGETVMLCPDAGKAKRAYQEKNKLCFGMIALGFGMATFIWLFLAAIFCYKGYVRAYGVPFMGVIGALGKQWVQTTTRANVTLYTSANASGLLSWLLPLKAAVLYDGGWLVSAEEYLSWTAMGNPALSVLCFLSLLAVTIKIVLDFGEKKSDKATWRIIRTYFVLLGGVFSTWLQALARGNFDVSSALLFSAFYAAFPVLVAWIWLYDKKVLRINAETLTLLSVGVIALAMFLLVLPCLFGYSVSTSATQSFQWMSWIRNKYFHI